MLWVRNPKPRKAGPSVNTRYWVRRCPASASPKFPSQLLIKAVNRKHAAAPPSARGHLHFNTRALCKRRRHQHRLYRPGIAEQRFGEPSQQGSTAPPAPRAAPAPSAPAVTGGASPVRGLLPAPFPSPRSLGGLPPVSEAAASAPLSPVEPG